MNRSTRTATLSWAALAVCSGFMIVTQVRVNGQLGAAIGDGYAAAVWSFGSGLVLLAALLPFSAKARASAAMVVRAVRAGSLRPWQALGGFGGAFLVLSQSVAASVTGVALFTIAVVAGQVAGGMSFDAVGLSPSGRRPVTTARAAGAVLVLAAAAVSLAGRADTGFPVWLLVLPLVSGVCVSWQQGVNGHVRAASSGYAATLFNFVTGTAVLLVALAVHAAGAGLPSHWPGNPLLYTGGVVGIGFIAIAVLAVRHLGVLVLGLCTISGQLGGAIVLDLALGPAVTAATVAGAGIALAGVAVASRGRLGSGPC
ncbi:DMT family transporter [Phytomonospora sp. NPDC050363]|uniref:DMT family transporter n=1 Tax=Phytomonospora sp. NPDC050363 TaxID=3155642 RepID=UPI00341189C3